MNIDIKKIKKESKDALKGNWGLSIFAIIILLAITTAIELPLIFLEGFLVAGGEISTATLVGIAVYMILFAIFVALPIGLGLCKFFLNIAEGKEAKISDLFYYRNWKQLIFTNLLVELIVLVIVGIYFGVLYVATTGFVSEMVSVVLMMLDIIFYIFALFYVSFGLSQVQYIIVEEYTAYVKTPIFISWQIMKGKRWDLFKLSLSFIGWILLACLTFGLLYFYVLPYMEVAMAKFYLLINEDKGPEIIK